MFFPSRSCHSSIQDSAHKHKLLSVYIVNFFLKKCFSFLSLFFLQIFPFCFLYVVDSLSVFEIMPYDEQSAPVDAMEKLTLATTTDDRSVTASQEMQAMNVIIPLHDCLNCRVALPRCQVKHETRKCHSVCIRLLLNHLRSILLSMMPSEKIRHGHGKSTLMNTKPHIHPVHRKKIIFVSPITTRMISIPHSFSTPACIGFHVNRL